MLLYACVADARHRCTPRPCDPCLSLDHCAPEALEWPVLALERLVQMLERLASMLQRLVQTLERPVLAIHEDSPTEGATLT